MDGGVEEPGPTRILIVDDRELVRFVMERALEKLDFACELSTVKNGREALEVMEEEQFDLMITDLKMPQLGGVELTRELRERGVDAAVVWITAYGCARFASEAERLGVFRCVEKPLEVHAMRKLAEQALMKRRESLAA